MLKKATGIGLCSGVRVGAGNLVLSHIQFADDLLVFSDANAMSLKTFSRVLKISELVAGLKLNLKKSKIFGINVDENMINSWALSINCGWASLPSSYLGLPLGHKRNSISLWQPVVWTKFNLVSRAGNTVADLIDKLIASFVWKGNSDRGIYWLNWRTVCGLKSRGVWGYLILEPEIHLCLTSGFGASVRRVKAFGKIIVAKYNYNPQSLLPKEVSLRSYSWVWRSIVNPVASQVGNLRADFIHIMGNGENIDFWNDCWSEANSLKLSFPRIYGLACKKSGMIYEFGVWSNGIWEWKIELRRGMFEWENVLWMSFLVVVNNVVSLVPAADKLKWVRSSDGRYTPKGFCNFVASLGKMEDPVWKAVWCKYVPPKVAELVWKAMNQRLPVIPVLIKRGVHISDQPLCPFCNSWPESINHILFHCQSVWQIWQ
ncbi:hypothetical protein F3Y22_tig00116960pilonHSYRG00031 [Hibiscus syriacus]|uniref:Reverse transcriptase domain-containing protein n=1 Tax=Hibiscus syriacus TaxID=106335 RepID=A0A6A2XYV0_HIBSY|nr:hypothetical protein F3Y22_tig00116960pilonHSYRG00031 [Hibiscus syriacus]